MGEFDWNKYIDLSQYLIDNLTLDDELRYRSAISRSYYAAFNKAKLFAQSKSWISQNNTYLQHSEVRNAFTNRGQLTVIVELLARMEGRRNSCDYDTILSFSKKSLRSIALEVLFEARQIFRMLGQN
jgi:uncharacterized protein (UPF0332 family)